MLKLPVESGVKILDISNILQERILFDGTEIKDEEEIHKGSETLLGRRRSA